MWRAVISGRPDLRYAMFLTFSGSPRTLLRCDKAGVARSDERVSRTARCGEKKICLQLIFRTDSQRLNIFDTQAGQMSFCTRCYRKWTTNIKNGFSTDTVVIRRFMTLRFIWRRRTEAVQINYCRSSLEFRKRVKMSKNFTLLSKTILFFLIFVGKTVFVLQQARGDLRLVHPGYKVYDHGSTLTEK